MIFYAHCSGDDSVGIQSMTAKIVFEDDCFWDQDMINDTKQMLRDFYDTSQVLTEAEHEAEEKALDLHIKQSLEELEKESKQFEP